MDFSQQFGGGDNRVSRHKKTAVSHYQELPGGDNGRFYMQNNLIQLVRQSAACYGFRATSTTVD
ncbi:MAG: hypothetical protein IAF02_13620 [Anaerolineae bacterium]|nr:hypothetical protein [Anaerolineae bacterium]